MAPKHGHGAKEDGSIKRSKSSPSRSATPAVHTEMPFSVVYPEEKKGGVKTENGAAHSGYEFQKSPFEANGANHADELDQYYRVEPQEEWSTMKKYNNFIIQGETFKNNQIVFVRSSEPLSQGGGHDSPKDFWIARILQVRAKDQQHVYALITWLYWPDELPPPKVYSSDQVTRSKGKRKYHGAFELVPSNYMEVLDVLSFAGKADVVQWNEDTEESPQSQLFWRQTYCRQTQALSKLKSHCTCNGYYNPDVGSGMYICDNSTCRLWMHKQCLEEDILWKTYERVVDGSHDIPRNTKLTKAKKSFKVHLKEIKSAKVKGQEEEESTSNEGETKAVITDIRKGVKTKEWVEDVHCLKCHNVIR